MNPLPDSFEQWACALEVALNYVPNTKLHGQFADTYTLMETWEKWRRNRDSELQSRLDK